MSFRVGGEPKNANKLVVEAPFKLATGQIQKMVLKLPLNVSTGSSYPLNIQSVSPTGDYNINFTDAAGLGYTLKNPGTNLSVFTSVAHNLKTRVLSSTGSTMTMTAGATTKVITTCNFNVNY